MNIFINDVHIKLLKPTFTIREQDYNSILDGDEFTPANLLHHVLIKNVSETHIDQLIEILDFHLPKNIYSLSLVPTDYEIIKTYFKGKYKILKAAGGLVIKKNKYLMIYRLNKWDLPKGKINKGETPEQAALREVEEECNIKAKLGKPICNTWHTYTMKKNKILKKTSWYTMRVIDDTYMKPQTVENIEMIKWMNPKEVFHSLDNSYESIRFVIQKHFNKKKK